MKTILGLDLGVSSIGWAIIQEGEEKSEILGMGSRIVPLNTDDEKEFVSGNSISKNQKRTLRRTQRKGYDRYQQRRKKLTIFLIQQKMFDENLFKLNQSDLWGIRSKAANEQVTLKELGRILYHLNQKRGYKSSRSDRNLDKKDGDYVAAVKSRHENLKSENLTIGQYFYNKLNLDQFYRTKEQVFPREAYIEEFDKIIKTQSKFHPEILTEEKINFVRNEVIYFQRPLKSQKDLVSVCEFEKTIKKIDGKKSFEFGPKVAHKTSPLFQLCKIWETVNNLSLKIKNNENTKNKWIDLHLNLEQKSKIANYLFENEKCTFNELTKLLNINKDEIYANKQIQKGLSGNITISEIKKYLNNDELLKLNVTLINNKKKTYLTDKKTGEIKLESESYTIDPKIEVEPLYKIWHTIYSINNHDECKNALIKNFNIDEQTAHNLANIDFSRHGFGNKSIKMMRKILPYLMQGFLYSDACELAGYNHSHKLSKDRHVMDKLELLDKNSLRQPIVEKILNQMINVINALIDKHGKFDEIRVELARELKQSKDERYETDKRNNNNKKLNDLIERKLKELNIPITKKTIQKYKFLYPTKEKYNEAKAINQCIYCGESFSLTEALIGNDFDVDHIIPKALLFDDSQTNKVLVHRKCNANKTNQTAFDYISKKGEQYLSDYLDRVENWFQLGIISYTKMQRLKVSFEEYQERKLKNKTTEADQKLWENFIDRQIRSTQYISKKAVELLNQICLNVNTTEGGVTAKLRRLWGWDDVLMNLQLPKMIELEQKTGEKFTEERTWTSNNGRNTHKKIVIKAWDKRDDHRHHAIDALVVASTKQGFIQRINTISSDDTKDELIRSINDFKTKNRGINKEVENTIRNESIFTEKTTKLEEYLRLQKPFSTKQVEEEASKILISFKAGKKVATKGTRKIKQHGKKTIVQKDIIIPRGALSEESVYGKIKTIKKKPLKFLIEHPESIVNNELKKIIKKLINDNNGELKKVNAEIKKNPIQLNNKNIEFADCYIEEVVIKKPIESLNENQVNDIVDEGIRTKVLERLREFNGNAKAAFKNLDEKPIWQNENKKIPIKNVRWFSGLSAIEPVSKNKNGKEISFVKPGNNHHLAIYINERGEYVEHICTFWHAVERKKFNLPVIIKNPKEVWDAILSTDVSYTQSFLSKIPQEKWVFKESLQQNEMFILDEFNNVEISRSNFDNTIRINQTLYRVQSLSTSDYYFRLHIETKIDNSNSSKLAKKYYRLKSLSAFFNLNPVKVRINNIGKIIK